jgi:hypothetical protein
MGWPYQIFVDLSEEEKHQRRELLDRYGAYAQLSALVPVFVYQLYRLARWVSSERRRAQPGYAAVPGSPLSKKSRSSPQGALSRRWRSFLWWVDGELAPGWGIKGHWIAALSWFSWLLFLSVHKTGVGKLMYMNSCLL